MCTSGRMFVMGRLPQPRMHRRQRPKLPLRVPARLTHLFLPRAAYTLPFPVPSRMPQAADGLRYTTTLQ